jgi:hypothetical protein
MDDAVMLPAGSETAAPRRPELRFCRECNDLMKPKVGPCAVCREVPVAAVMHALSVHSDAVPWHLPQRGGVCTHIAGGPGAPEAGGELPLRLPGGR